MQELAIKQLLCTCEGAHGGNENYYWLSSGPSSSRNIFLGHSKYVLDLFELCKKPKSRWNETCKLFLGEKPCGGLGEMDAEASGKLAGCDLIGTWEWEGGKQG